MAMLGKDCLAIASDKRFGSNMTTISNDFPKLFEFPRGWFWACPVWPRMFRHCNLVSSIFIAPKYSSTRRICSNCKRAAPISPKSLAHLISSTLYSKRFSPFFVEPILAGWIQRPAIHLLHRCHWVHQLCQGFRREWHGKPKPLWHLRVILRGQHGTGPTCICRIRTPFSRP